MRSYEPIPDKPMPEEADEVIDEMLAGRPRAIDLAEMVAALESRREAFTRELASAENEVQIREWQARIREVDAQIKTLQEEQAITGFVENSIRVSVNRPRHEMDIEFDL